MAWQLVTDSLTRILAMESGETKPDRNETNWNENERLGISSKNGQKSQRTLPQELKANKVVFRETCGVEILFFMMKTIKTCLLMSMVNRIGSDNDTVGKL